MKESERKEIIKFFWWDMSMKHFYEGYPHMTFDEKWKMFQSKDRPKIGNIENLFGEISNGVKDLK